MPALAGLVSHRVERTRSLCIPSGFRPLECMSCADLLEHQSACVCDMFSNVAACAPKSVLMGFLKGDEMFMFMLV